uniref:Uncharacterized protein n=1 Tax=Minutocellus polymorphus TaxID=265543 RepID=A0A7S0FJ45_9STRA
MLVVTSIVFALSHNACCFAVVPISVELALATAPPFFFGKSKSSDLTTGGRTFGPASQPSFVSSTSSSAVMECVWMARSKHDVTAWSSQPLAREGGSGRYRVGRCSRAIGP